MYYYRWKGATLVSPAPLEGFGPETDPAADGPIFALVPGDPVLGRGSFRVNHPGQLLAGHGLEALDASRLPWVEALLRQGRLTELDRVTMAETIREVRVFPDQRLEIAYAFSDDAGILQG